MIKDKRKELIKQQENLDDTEPYEKKEKLTQYNNSSPEHEYQANITFSEKMNTMIKREKANIRKIKQEIQKKIKKLKKIKKRKKKKFMKKA